MFKKNFFILFFMLFLITFVNFANITHGFTIFDNIDPPIDFLQKTSDEVHDTQNLGLTSSTSTYKEDDVFIEPTENLGLTSSINSNTTYDDAPTLTLEDTPYSDTNTLTLEDAPYSDTNTLTLEDAPYSDDTR
jgi:hypothetical protein